MVEARYRYLLTDVMTRRVLADAPNLTITSYGRVLNGPRECRVSVDLSDPTVRRLTDPILATEPRRTALWIIRDEQPVWGGIIWTRKYKSGSATFDLEVSSWESYLARRRIRRDYLFRQWDQHDILRNFVGTLQTEPPNGIGNVHIAVPPLRADSGRPPRDRDYWWHERATYLERMKQLADVIGGPDWTLEPGWAADGLPQVTLLCGTPMGRVLSGLLVEYPGDVISYAWDDDGGDSANYWTAIGDVPEGSPEGTPPVMRDAQISAEWAAGVPLLEDVSKHQGVTNPWTAQEYANSNVAAAAGNRVVPQATVRLPAGSPLPGLGDRLSVRVTDPHRFPADRETAAPGLTAATRILGWDVSLGSDQGETLTATLAETTLIAPRQEDDG